MDVQGEYYELIEKIREIETRLNKENGELRKEIEELKKIIVKNSSKEGIKKMCYCIGNDSKCNEMSIFDDGK